MEEFVSPNLSWSNFENTLVLHRNTIVCMLLGLVVIIQVQNAES
jgi:hypothetical protein